MHGMAFYNDRTARGQCTGRIPTGRGIGQWKITGSEYSYRTDWDQHFTQIRFWNWFSISYGRINDGLYSERQVPLLRELLQSYREAGDYEALDERYDYYFRLYGNGQPPYTEIRLRAALEYLRWQREALRLGVGGRELERLAPSRQA